MYTRAERFDTIHAARARFTELSKRLLGPQGKGMDFAMTSGSIDGVPHVLLMGMTAPPADSLRGNSGEVVTVHPSVWESLWLRHDHQRPPFKGESRRLTRREPGKGVVLRPDGTTVDPKDN